MGWAQRICGELYYLFPTTQIQVLANKVLDFKNPKAQKAKVIFKKDHPKSNRDLIELQAT